MDGTLAVKGTAEAQRQQIATWLDSHLKNGLPDVEFLTIHRGDTGTTYRIINTKDAVRKFQKCLRYWKGTPPVLRYSFKVKSYPKVERLRPKGAKFWEEEVARLQDKSRKSEYADLSDVDRAELIRLATKNLELGQRQEQETTSKGD